jgi:hypothetical protein
MLVFDLEFFIGDPCDLLAAKEDLHRITLWLDCNSDFFGSYKKTEVQAAGQIAQPTLH